MLCEQKVYTNIQKLDCSYCPIEKIPHIIGTRIYTKKCQWLKRKEEYKENIEKLICLQRIFIRYILIKGILKVSKQIIPIWWDKGRIYV